MEGVIEHVILFMKEVLENVFFLFIKGVIEYVILFMEGVIEYVTQLVMLSQTNQY